MPRYRSCWPAVAQWLLRSLGPLTVLSALAAASAASAAAASFSGGAVNTGGFSSGTLQLEGTTGAAHCYSTGTGSGGLVGSNSAPCSSGSPVPSGKLSTAPGAATTTLASVGTVAGTADEVSSGSCGPPELADQTGGDTGVAFGGLTFQTAGPMGGGAIAVDGSTGWADTTVSYTDPEDFTVLVWFKTSVAQGGMLGLNSQWNPTTSVRFGIHAVVHEFNCNWIAGLKDYPSARHWQDYGANLATVFYDYFDGV